MARADSRVLAHIRLARNRCTTTETARVPCSAKPATVTGAGLADAISLVKRDTRDRPLEEVAIKHLKIVRVKK